MRPWGFPLVYLGWAFLFWTPIFGSEESVWAGTNLLFLLVGGASPLIAGVTMAGSRAAANAFATSVDD